MDGSPPPASPGVPPGDPLIGTVLAGRYKILRRLGAGAMGSVYLGEHLRFGRHDAIKVLQGGIQRDREATERFLRGARNASAINHPHVCTVYDFGDTDEGHQFLAMEFVEGEALSDVIEESGPVSLERGIEITRQIGDALDAAHHLGIVHRDLKPGNVMLSRDRTGRDHVKVVDFDIAKGSTEGEGSEVTRTGFVVGTPEYMSPEQLTGDPLDGRSDVYSLALVFVRIVTGRLPFRSTTTQNLMVERLTEQPLRLADIAPDLHVPHAVQAAVDHALERRREDRPATAGAFTAALRGTAAAASSAPTPGVAPAPAAAPSRPSNGGGASVPETRVGAPPTAPAAAATAGAPAKRSPVPFLIGGAVVIAAGFGVIQFVGGPDDATESPGVEVTEAPGALEGIDPGTDSEQEGGVGGGDDSNASSDGNDASSGGSSGTSTAGDAPASGGSQTGGGSTGAETPETPGTNDPPDPPTPRMTAAAAVALLGRLEVSADDPANYAAVTDSATMIYEDVEFDSVVRAQAAYVLYYRYALENRRNEALTWIQRAVDLDEENADYQMFLDLARRSGGGRP